MPCHSLSNNLFAFGAVLLYNVGMDCKLCPVNCGADRSARNGFCGVSGIKIAKYYLHPYEEPPVSFSGGSGCVFFCGCSLKCVFCQNYEVSRAQRGREVTVRGLADIFRELEERGADNINLVNPTHYAEHIAEAMDIYRPKIPVVYNTHGYEKLSTLKLASSFTDIWLPDFKFMDPVLSKRYTGRADYADFARPAIEYMARKPLVMRGDGKMLSGCIVRHLILPLAAYDSVNVVRFVASLPRDVYFSLMSQYTPFGDIKNFKELQRPITSREYAKVLAAVEECGLENVFLQDRESSGKAYIPEWDY